MAQDRPRCHGNGKPCKNFPCEEGQPYCRNHDPRLAEQRKANGAKRRAPRSQPAEPLPPGWRPTWRRPRKRADEAFLDAQSGVDDLIARATSVLDVDVAGPAPAAAELREEAIRVLRTIANHPLAASAARVAAAKALLESIKPAGAGPVGPVSPWLPCGPVGPVKLAPVGPVGPVTEGPVGPVFPCCPVCKSAGAEAGAERVPDARPGQKEGATPRG